MPYHLLLHPDIEQDLIDIANLIADFAGNQVAERKLTEIEERLIKLAETPHIGSIRDDIYPGLRVIPVAKKGVVTFIVNDELKTVQIVSITYAGADWFARINDRNE